MKHQQLAVLRAQQKKGRGELLSLVQQVGRKQLLTLRYRKREAVASRRRYLAERAADRLKRSATPEPATSTTKGEEDIIDIEGNADQYIGDNLKAPTSVATPGGGVEMHFDDEWFARVEREYADKHGCLPDGYVDLQREFTAAEAVEATPSSVRGAAGGGGGRCGSTETPDDVIFEIDEDEYMSDRYEIENVFDNLDDDEDATTSEDIEDMDTTLSEDSHSLEVV